MLYFNKYILNGLTATQEAEVQKGMEKVTSVNQADKLMAKFGVKPIPMTFETAADFAEAERAFAQSTSTEKAIMLFIEEKVA